MSAKEKVKQKEPKTKLPVDPQSVKAEAEGKLEAGVLQPIAASFLMQTLYGARYARPDLPEVYTRLPTIRMGG